MKTEYSTEKVSAFSIEKLMHIEKILYRCGKDMAQKENLRHWDNSHLKNLIIVALCVLKNTLYLVSADGVPAATFQTKKIGEKYRFQKLATDPDFSGRGIGSFCMSEIEKQAADAGCKTVTLEVYEKSLHAKAFYEHRGYTVTDRISTLKYSELVMEKTL